MRTYVVCLEMPSNKHSFNHNTCQQLPYFADGQCKSIPGCTTTTTYPSRIPGKHPTKKTRDHYLIPSKLLLVLRTSIITSNSRRHYSSRFYTFLTGSKPKAKTQKDKKTKTKTKSKIKIFTKKAHKYPPGVLDPCPGLYSPLQAVASVSSAATAIIILIPALPRLGSCHLPYNTSAAAATVLLSLLLLLMLLLQSSSLLLQACCGQVQSPSILLSVLVPCFKDRLPSLWLALAISAACEATALKSSRPHSTPPYAQRSS